jgi:hypothetical protein
MNQVLLRRVFGIRADGNERQQSIDSLQDLGKVLRVLVICFDPSHARGSAFRGSVLSEVRVSDMAKNVILMGSDLPGEKEDLMLLPRHKRVNDLLANICK